MSLLVDFGLYKKTAASNFVYKDIDTKNILGSRGDVGTNTDIDAIRRGMKNIFSFTKGERILEPEFGHDLFKYIYEQANDSLVEAVKTDIRALLTRWEPRVRIENIDVLLDKEQQTMWFEVTYFVPQLSQTYRSDYTLTAG